MKKTLQAICSFISVTTIAAAAMLWAAHREDPIDNPHGPIAVLLVIGIVLGATSLISYRRDEIKYRRRMREAARPRPERRQQREREQVIARASAAPGFDNEERLVLLRPRPS